MAAADAAIVVISAVPSEHEPALKVGGQAWNHCMATKSMVGISRYIIAITKMDLIDFSKDAFDELCTKVCWVMILRHCVGCSSPTTRLF